jgi:hypothetical protein
LDKKALDKKALDGRPWAQRRNESLGVRAAFLTPVRHARAACPAARNSRDFAAVLRQCADPFTFDVLSTLSMDYTGGEGT